jgi:hypothetical protein
MASVPAAPPEIKNRLARCHLPVFVRRAHPAAAPPVRRKSDQMSIPGLTATSGEASGLLHTREVPGWIPGALIDSCELELLEVET